MMPNATILIVEDNPDTLIERELLVVNHLHQSTIVSCHCALDAVDIAASREIDGAIVSVNMSDVNGIEVCRQLKSDIRTRHIPVMLVCEHQSSTELRIRGLEAGADGFVTQPIETEEFIARLRVMLRNKRAKDEQRAAHDRLAEIVAEHSAALHSSEQRYRRLVDISPDMIAVCSEDKIIFASAAAEKILGISSADHLIGKAIFQIVHPDSLPQLERLKHGDVGERDQGMSYVEMQLIRNDGDPIDVEATGVLFDDRGESHLQLVFRDITQRKRFAERAKQSQRMEAVGQLAGGVAHDFNNVLTTIRGYSELVLESIGKGDPLREDLDEIRAATDRAAALTRQLLAFSRRQVLEPKPLTLNTVVLEMKRMLNRIIGEDIELITDLDVDLATIKADRSQIEQVLMNLAVNARDAILEGGKITIHTQNISLSASDIARRRIDLKPNDYVLMEVTDTGMGMSAQTLFHIFEPFYTTKDKGTGLGLSTVYGIIKQSGGEVSVTSAPGKGTCFCVYLPVVPDEAIRTGLPEPIRIRTDNMRGNETVLLVEDENSVRMLAKRMLQRTGYTVLSARHGGEALTLCKDHKASIHLILTDIVMPQMGGRELVERVLALHPETKILLMSGYSDHTAIALEKAFFNITFLKKPFSYSELTAKVRQALDSEPTRSREA
ncbi:MAG: response regulator [Myxococcota bacterium]|nr:response regulator [Myxococcota bacterium]